jgi:glycosyltransferase involved in cell wall biosynthesis
VINEAMACRLPVISTYASQAALEMIVNGKNGYIVKEADVDELFLSLKKLVCSPELRREMGEKSFEIVIKKFNISEMTYGFIKAIKYVLNRNDRL